MFQSQSHRLVFNTRAADGELKSEVHAVNNKGRPTWTGRDFRPTRRRDFAAFKRKYNHKWNEILHGMYTKSFKCLRRLEKKEKD